MDFDSISIFFNTIWPGWWFLWLAIGLTYRVAYQLPEEIEGYYENAGTHSPTLKDHIFAIPLLFLCLSGFFYDSSISTYSNYLNSIWPGWWIVIFIIAFFWDFGEVFDESRIVGMNGFGEYLTQDDERRRYQCPACSGYLKKSLDVDLPGCKECQYTQYCSREELVSMLQAGIISKEEWPEGCKEIDKKPVRDVNSAFIIWPLLIFPFSLYFYDPSIRIESNNFDQIKLWYEDSSNFIIKNSESRLNTQLKVKDRIKEIAPALNDVTVELNQSIKEKEYLLFALKDVLAEYYKGPTGSVNEDYKAIQSFERAGIYDGVRVGIYLRNDGSGLIEKVLVGSPADRANIKVGDQVLRYNDDVLISTDYSRISREIQGTYRIPFQQGIRLDIKPSYTRNLRPKGYPVPWGVELKKDASNVDIISKIFDRSIGYKSGLQVGDSVISIDGIKLETTNSLSYVKGELSKTNKPSSIFKVLRNNKIIDIEIENKYSRTTEYNVRLLPENIPFLMQSPYKFYPADKDYINLVNKINTLYYLKGFYEFQEEELYMLDKRASLKSSQRAKGELSRMINEVENSIERNKKLIKIK